jgi:hypothetical protein
MIPTGTTLSKADAKTLAQALAKELRLGKSTEQRLLEAEAKEAMKALRTRYTVTDTLFTSTVNLVCDDGSTFLLKDAEVIELTPEWVAIFTEHHGYFVYHRSDVVTLEVTAPKPTK